MAADNPSLNDAPAPADGRCGGCARFSQAQASLAAYGFGRCALRPAWVEMSRRASCHFNPSRWSPAP